MLLDEIIRARRDAIVAAFVDRSRESIARSARQSEAGIVDHVPRLLDELADAIETGRTSLPGAKRTAQEHAQTRWHQGMDIRTLVREYAILRTCVLDVAAVSSAAEVVALDRFFNTSIADAVEEFVAMTEGQTTALRAQLQEENERLASMQASLTLLADAGAILASTSADPRQALHGLAGLCVQQFADGCSLYFIDAGGPTHLTIAHRFPEKAALLRELYERFPLSADAPYGFPATQRTGRPEIVRDVSDAFYVEHAIGPEHLALLRAVGAVSWMVVPLRVDGREPIGAMVVMRAESGRNFSAPDLALAEELARRTALVLDHARLFEAARRERARAETATRAKDEFLAVVSHELRTPLNAVLGWTRMLRARDADAEKVAHGLAVIERNAAAQAQLIGDLLDVSRIVTGNVRLEIGSVEMSNVVEMAIEAIRPAADAKAIRLEAHVDPEAGVIRGDPARLQQIVWNLLTNAVKFTPKNGRVSVRLARVSSDIEIVVDDDGEGIDPGTLPFIFERFRQEDATTTRSYGGLGLGLAIARHLVELHGGSIRAASSGKGRGSTFTVRMPLSPVTTTAITPPPLRPPEHVSRPLNAAKVAGMRVLVVEDEADARDLLAALLTGCGVEIRTAPSVAAGFDEFLRFRPDVVLSDIGMPVEDGHALARKIRALPDEAGAGTPLIALTAFTGAGERMRARVEGFSAHVSKPVEPSELLDVIGSFRFGRP